MATDTTWDDEAALAHREELRDDAVNRLRMLRFTLTERIERARDEQDSCKGFGLMLGAALNEGKASAYRDVLSLIGPDYDLPTDDDEQPF